MALDEQRGLLKWTNQPFSYNEKIVWDGRGVPLHPAGLPPITANADM